MWLPEIQRRMSGLVALTCWAMLLAISGVIKCSFPCEPFFQFFMEEYFWSLLLFLFSTTSPSTQDLDFFVEKILV